MKAALTLCAAMVLAGCAQPPKPAPPPPAPAAPKYSERVILLPNRDGRSSSVIVKRASGEQELSRPFQGVELSAGKEQKAQLTGGDVEERYGAVLQAQPARPFSYTLFFNSGTTDLTAQSKVSLNEVRVKIKSFPAAQVMVTGHTDRVGTVEANDALSAKRASAVRDMLIQIGIPKSAIEIVGRGEREPLVLTADGKADERNRRVEIKLR